jgi:very-short-patch-repair endonuclease
VVRFWNNDVLANTAGVMQEIEKELPSPPLPGPLPRGERGK